MESKGSLRWSQEPLLAPVPTQINPAHALSLYFIKINFNIILLLKSVSSELSLSLSFPSKTLYESIIPPYVPHALPLSSSLI